MIERRFGAAECCVDRMGDASHPEITDISAMTWLDREERWLLDGKNVYLAREDAAGVSALERRLDAHGVPFVIERRDDAIVFSCDRLREWWASTPEAA